MVGGRRRLSAAFARGNGSLDIRAGMLLVLNHNSGVPYIQLRKNTDYILQIGEKSATHELYFSSYSAETGKWEPEQALATKSDLDNSLTYKHTFTGDFNNTNIAFGVYQITTNNSYTNGPSELPAYCTFVQFPGFYKLQMIIDGGKIYTRKYTGDPATWGPWRWYSGVVSN